MSREKKSLCPGGLKPREGGVLCPALGSLPRAALHYAQRGSSMYWGVRLSRGGGSLSSGSLPREGGLCPGGSLSREGGSLSRGGFYCGGSLSRGYLSSGSLPREGGSLSRGSLPRGGLCPWGVSVQRVSVQ